MIKLSKFSQLGFGIIMLLVILYLGSKVDFIFKPVISLFTVITVPLMLSAFFYYLLRPVVDFLARNKMNRTAAILLIYLVIALILAGFIVGVWPSLREQLVNLVESAPDLFNALSRQLQEWEQNEAFSGLIPEGTSVISQVTEYLNKGFTFLTDYVTSLISVISNIAVILFIFPVILFYQLKEGGKFGKAIVRSVPKRFQGDAAEVVGDIDNALSGYIIGRVIANLALGVLMFIGFILIDLPYALLLTVIAIILNFIPFVGAFLSAIPIVIIGLIESPTIALWSLVIILLAQQIQDNLIAPYIYGKQLDIHPLTTIVLVLIGSDLAGIIGMLIIIPCYMIVKILAVKAYQLFFKEKWENA
ncbi:AI-2E family transporter [Cohnella algarum]|uniref:AI-2E family transporter n=1 Tax=Cohnella algarum TaxID=2044859 RepID=UPI00196834C8|nr:AI-2E family transporter [Cohnella algarum]MBN2980422.1 AI-2E family transporter [Cohnella algarum]